tara:strand:- start:21295 stop:23313 length:2019 start_codon:yes stop_codon:yes gene_type:complete
MGISTVTPRSFNSTGAQSICRANAPDDEKLIESQFLTQCQTEYIHGSGETFVRGSLSSLPTTGSPASTSNQDTFYLGADVDAISDITLSVSLDMAAQTSFYTAAEATSTTIGIGTSDFNSPMLSTITKDFLLSMINKIEMRVGGLTVQTILPEEIFMRNLSELATTSLDDWLSSGVTAVNRDGLVSNPSHSGTANYSIVERFSLSELDNMSNLPRGNNIMLVRDGTRYTWTLSIPFMGRSNDMHNCFLQSGAVSNSIVMVVFYNAAFPNGKTGSKQFSRIKFPGTASGSSGAQTRGIYGLIRDLNCSVDTSGAPHGVLPADLPGKSFINTYKSWLTVRSHTFTKTESDFVQKNIINRIVTASQSVSREILGGEVVGSESTIADITPRNGVSVFSAPSTHHYSFYQDMFLPNYKSASPSVISYTNKQTVPIAVDLQNFDLIASHLLIGAFAPVHNTDGSVSVPPLEISWDITNGTNFPGASWDPLTGAGKVDPINAAVTTNSDLVPFISQESLSFTGYSLGSQNKCVGPFGCSIRGILDNWLDSVEVRIGSDSTGRLPAESLLKTGEEFGLTSAGGAPIYVVPLADKPFSTAGVPMARVGLKQVILHVDQRYAMSRGPFTQFNGSYDTPVTGTEQDPKTTKKLYSWAPITKVSVVGVGTRVQTTVGGGTSFAS